MKKLLIGTLALFLSLHATAESNTVSTEKLPIEKLSKEVAVFYKNPSDTRAVNLLDGLVKADLMRHTTIVWASQVLQKYPQVSTAWCNKIRTYHDNAQTFATYTLAMTGTPQAQTCINSLTLDAALKNGIEQIETFHPLQEPMVSPASLDFLWVTYYATGNPKAVERILDYIIKAQTAAEQHPNHVDLMLASAIWSTRSNMEQDSTIDNIVRKYIQNQSKDNKKLLEQALLKPQKQ
ncbi:hypothetical protein [Neisseria sp. P0019.S003]|jgi:hypothetical protein|uniref:hypothetical protein n=1 Tax=Neisseria sp. P0019.S003 TaxID=3436799 RepID=UPI003F80D4E8